MRDRARQDRAFQSRSLSQRECHSGRRLKQRQYSIRPVEGATKSIPWHQSNSWGVAGRGSMHCQDVGFQQQHLHSQPRKTSSSMCGISCFMQRHRWQCPGKMADSYFDCHNHDKDPKATRYVYLERKAFLFVTLFKSLCVVSSASITYVHTYIYTYIDMQIYVYIYIYRVST